MVEFSERVGKYINTEEFLKTKDLGTTDEGLARVKRKQDSPERGPGKKQKVGQQRGGQDQILAAFTPLS